MSNLIGSKGKISEALKYWHLESKKCDPYPYLKAISSICFYRRGNIFPYFISDTRPVPRTPSAAGDDEDDSITDSSFFLEKFQMAFKASALDVMKQAFADMASTYVLPSLVFGPT